MPRQDLPRHTSWILIAPALACVAFVAMESAHFRVNGLTRAAYFVVLAVALLSFAFAMLSELVPARGMVIFAVSLLMVAIGLAPSATSSGNVHLAWLLGDIGTLILFGTIAALSASVRRLYVTQRTMLFALTVLGASALWAAFPGATDFGRITRHRPPSSLLIAAVVIMAVHCSRGSTPRIRTLAPAAGLLLLLAGLTITSGFRISTVQLIVAIAAGLLIAVGFRAAVGATVVVLVILSTLTSVGIVGVNIESAADGSRFEELSGGELDASILGRLQEAELVTEAVTSGTTMHLLFGFGHGAGYAPERKALQRASVDGLFHSIHIGPARVLYRYGLLGLVTHAVLFAILLKKSFYLLASYRSQSVGPIAAALALACILALIEFFVFNPLISASSTLSLAYVAGVERRPRPGVHRAIRRPGPRPNAAKSAAALLGSERRPTEPT